MTENTIIEYLEQMKNDLCMSIVKVIDEKFETIEEKNDKNFERMQEENNQNFERMKEENKRTFEGMQEENKRTFERMQQENDKRFKGFLDQMNRRFDEQDKEIISIKRSLAVIEEDHGRKLDVLYETRLNSIEREVENAMKIQKLEARVQNLEYKQLGI